MASVQTPLKQEIELKDFKGDVFGLKFSIIKDEATGEVMFDFVQLPDGFDLKKIKFFRVKGNDIASVEAELKKLVKKDSPTAVPNPFIKKTADQLSELSDEEIAKHLSLGEAEQAYTSEQSVELGRRTKALKNSKAAATGASTAATGAPPATATTSGAPPVTGATPAAVATGASPVAVATGAPPVVTGAPPATASGAATGAPPAVTASGAPPAAVASGAPPAATATGAPAAPPEYTNVLGLDGGRRKIKNTTRKHKK